jgi:hypothetical protein
MGYTTDFEGAFDISPDLKMKHYAYLLKFSESRRMKRDEKKLAKIKDPARKAVGRPVGVEGEFFVSGEGFMGQDNDSSVLDGNRPPKTQPGLWCQWVPSEDGTQIEWNGAEKFYDYVDWLKYIVKNFLKPWGYKLNGCVEWKGEESGDIGKIKVKNNVVSVYPGRVVYGDEE